MSVTQYIGARYVPIIADPIDWSADREYEPLTIVYHAGNSYTSKQAVPKGIQIDNDGYWALTGNYNAQIEQYRKDAVNAATTAKQALELAKTNEQDIAANDSELAGTADSGLKTLITENKTDADNKFAGTSDSGLKTLITENKTDADNKFAGIVDSGLKTLITENKKDADNKFAGIDDSGLKTLITENKKDADAKLLEKAPISHASAETTYGIGTQTEYGHVKLTDSVVSTESADAGKAVTGKAVAVALADSVSRYKNILCIGDSYLEGFSPDGNVTPWGTVLRTMYGCKGHNTALGGTGFVNKASNKNFTNLINDAANGTGYDTDFDCVIIGGGFNDRGDNESSIANGVKSALDAVYTHWPNATVYVFGFLWGCKGYGASTENKSKAAQDVVNSYKNKNNLFYCPGCWTWNIGHTERVASDKIHPNQSGQNTIANCMLQFMNGGDPTVYSEKITASSSNILITRNYDTLAVVFSSASGAPDTLVGTFDENYPVEFAVPCGLGTLGGQYVASFYTIANNELKVFGNRVDANGYGTCTVPLKQSI